MVMARPEQCATIHSAMIYDRGGKHRVERLVNLQSVRWGRVIDDISDATVTINAENCQRQADVLSQIEPKRHEMVIYRGEDRVWEGPIRRVSWKRTGVSIVAGDCLDYFDATPLSKNWPGPDAPVNPGPPLMTDRISNIVNYELTTPYTMTTNTGTVTVPRWETIATPINVLPYFEVRAGTVLTRSDTVAFEMTLYEHLRALGRSGVDYTMIGRKLLVWDSANSIGRIKTLTDADFLGEINVYSDGSDHASVAHVSADRSAEDTAAAVGNAGGVNSYYGVWTSITTTQNEDGTAAPTQLELNTQAQRHLTGRTPVPIYLQVPSESGIQLSHDLTINDLVPGVEVPVLAKLNLKQVSQTQRLKRVTVTEDGGGENIAISLTTQGVET